MVHRDIQRTYFPRRIVLLIALLFGSTLTSCKGSLSDFDKRQQAQAKAVTALTDLGAKNTKLDKKGIQGWKVDLSQVPFSSSIADQLKILGLSINILNLSKTSINDSQLAELVDQTALASIVELDLSHNSSITDQSLEKLEGLTFLSDLNLTGTQVTEAGIARLQQKRKADFHLDESTKQSIAKQFKVSVPETFNREMKIRH